MIQFQHIEYLLGLLAVPLMVVLYFLLIRWKKLTIQKIGDPALVQQLISHYSPSKFRFKFILFLVAFSIGIIALANPREPMGSNLVSRNGIDVMIALDVSKSMLAQDIKPNRLERAKQVVAKLIDKLPEDRIGIVVFAGRAYLQMPLTTDHSAAKMYLSAATTDVVPTQGTVIGDALKMCYAAFNTKEKKYKSIILISDGEDHEENALTMAKALFAEGVMINTIGIGSPEGATITDVETNEVKRDAAGNPVITKLNEAGLKSIATNSNGIYQLFTNSDEVVTRLQAQLKSMEGKNIRENSLINYQVFFQWLLAIVLILLLAELLTSEIKTVRKNKPSKKNTTTIALVAGSLLLIFSMPARAQSYRKLIQKGNEAYQKKQYSIAGEQYKMARDKNPANATASYNLGNALYKSQQPEDALLAYNAAIENSRLPVDRSGAFYNKGVVLQNGKKLPECIDAYKNALRLNPGDEDARLNLQKALQQQQQNQQNEDKEKKQPKDAPKKNEPQSGQQKRQDDPPKPAASKMTKKEAEEKLKALLQQEKKLQDKLRKVNAASPEKPEKDW